MKYIAHINGVSEQSVKDHLIGTARLTAQFADKFGKADWGYCCGLLHDIGKYSKQFQNKIINNTDDKVDHSTAGAKLCMELGGVLSVIKLLYSRTPCWVTRLWKYSYSFKFKV